MGRPQGMGRWAHFCLVQQWQESHGIKQAVRQCMPEAGTTAPSMHGYARMAHVLKHT